MSKIRKIKLAVSEFAQPVRKTGSLTRDGLLLGMQLGVDVHRAMQEHRAKDGFYKAEVPLKWDFATKRFTFQVRGKADGIYFGEKPLVEEIKTTFSLERLVQAVEKDPWHPYRLQALTYAHIMRMQGKDPQARLLLVSLRNRREVEIPLALDGTFESWLGDRLVQLEQQWRLRRTQQRKRRGLAKTLSFPFARPRPHQDALLALVEKTVTEGDNAMLQAPTGIGKTIGVLFPTLKGAFARGQGVIYVAPKNRQFTVAKDVVARLDPAARAIKTYVLTAKRKLCRKQRMDCNPDYCEYAADYHDKVAKHRLADLLKGRAIVEQKDFEEVAEEYRVCPYQLQMDTLENADMIIGDYNYVFSPRAGLADLFKDRRKEDKLCLVVDEAHNLHVRASEYFSPRLEISELISISTYRPSQALQKSFDTLIADAIDLVESYRPSDVSSQVDVNVEAFVRVRQRLQSFAIDYFVECEELWDNDPVLEFYRHWSEFVEVLQGVGSETVVSYIIDGTREYLQLTCCDPARHLKELYKEFHATTAFSATLKPFEFYSSLCGLHEAKTREFFTAFPNENRKVLLIPQVSTTYRQRGRFYQAIAEAVARISAVENGNYLVFFPSYDFLEKMHPLMWSDDHEILAQSRSMKAEDLERLENAAVDGDRPTIVLAVQGGALSEGVDFNSPHLKGVFVIGPAIPMVSFEREILKAYYDEKFGEGFSYAYAYPAMARSVQASGRVIRSAEKRGLIVLLDGRFVRETYARAMPGFWFKESPQELVSTKIIDDVTSFWRGGEVGKLLSPDSLCHLGR